MEGAIPRSVEGWAQFLVGNFIHVHNDGFRGGDLAAQNKQRFVTVSDQRPAKPKPVNAPADGGGQGRAEKRREQASAEFEAHDQRTALVQAGCLYRANMKLSQK